MSTPSGAGRMEFASHSSVTVLSCTDKIAARQDQHGASEPSAGLSAPSHSDRDTITTSSINRGAGRPCSARALKLPKLGAKLAFTSIILITVSTMYLGWESAPDVKNKCPAVCKKKGKETGPSFKTLPHVWVSMHLRMVLCKSIKDCQTKINLAGIVMDLATLGMALGHPAEVVPACPQKPAQWDTLTHALWSSSLHVPKAH